MLQGSGLTRRIPAEKHTDGGRNGKGQKNRTRGNHEYRTGNPGVNEESGNTKNNSQNSSDKGKDDRFGEKLSNNNFLFGPQGQKESYYCSVSHRICHPYLSF